MIPNFVLCVMVIFIIALEYLIKKKSLGIIILHNNDHTLNKILQKVTSFVEKYEIQFQILVIKEEKIKKHRSTGYLFNLGYKQISRMENFLFIDTTHCKLQDLYDLDVNGGKLKSEDIFVKDSLHFIKSWCGVFISRKYFKKIDGFSNKPNTSFNEFMVDLYRNIRDKYGGYFSTHLNIEYHIIERLMLNTNTSRLTIKYS